jgi:hypothetical protein
VLKDTLFAYGFPKGDNELENQRDETQSEADRKENDRQREGKSHDRDA